MMLIAPDMPHAFRECHSGTLLEGTQPVAYTGWPVKSEHVEVGIFQRTRNL